jgi:hypothetical protein
MNARWSQWPILDLCGDTEGARGWSDEAGRWRAQAADIASFLAEHAAASGLRESFLKLPRVQRLTADTALRLNRVG